ncbi:hypothetical protein SAMN05192563_102413 [Paraburkholderia aspalathi]|uniref:Uncharacterized protein n=1 Tax=Paraburkholderia aspalathi TaxID=1324617 RepID=A0A1I7EJ28_9BURK|nr:hypothetical protein SAMN05192563_102413 [Paraburkholderia aspalathi]
MFVAAHSNALHSCNSPGSERFGRRFSQHPRAYCTDDAPLAAASGVVLTASSLDAAAGLLAGAASLARLAASLVPGVPLNPAELLITPLLPELMASLLVSSTFLQPVAAMANPDIDRISRIFFTFSLIATSVKRGARMPLPVRSARIVSGRCSAHESHSHANRAASAAPVNIVASQHSARKVQCALRSPTAERFMLSSTSITMTGVAVEPLSTALQ